PAGVAAPSVVVALDPLDAVEGALSGAATAPLDAAHPQLLVYSRQAEALRLAARGVAAGRWPRVQFAFKSDYVYPDTPALKTAWQNTAALSASVPLFEFGRTRRRAEAEEDQASASDRRRDEARDELERDWLKARDELAALRDEEALDRESVAETDELARLRYASYRSGGSTILDVETADADAVQAKVLAARTRVQALIQLATLDSLSAGPEER
ncbi:MAG: TolC family protein, partial [Elusimicrobia bacterium]|nr:TolC family protein [Elusimicrobiota bacterium]